MSPRLSGSVKRILRKRRTDFDPFLFVFSNLPARFLPRARAMRWRARATPRELNDAASALTTLAEQKLSAGTLRREGRFDVTSLDHALATRLAPARLTQSLTRHGNKRATEPPALVPLTAEKPWSHDGALRLV